MARSSARKERAAQDLAWARWATSDDRALRSLSEVGEGHFRGLINGELFDYWPTTGRWRWRRRSHKGTLSDMLNALVVARLDTQRAGGAAFPRRTAVSLWTDGGCKLTNGRVGSWAYVLEAPHALEAPLRRSGHTFRTTNNRMELSAVLYGLGAVEREGLQGEVSVYSDSEYVVKGTMVWSMEWRQRGWVTASGGEVANADLWQEMHARLGRLRHHDLRVRVHWVKGHAGVGLNPEVDRMCTEAMREALRRGLDKEFEAG